MGPYQVWAYKTKDSHNLWIFHLKKKIRLTTIEKDASIKKEGAWVFFDDDNQNWDIVAAKNLGESINDRRYCTPISYEALKREWDRNLSNTGSPFALTDIADRQLEVWTYRKNRQTDILWIVHLKEEKVFQSLKEEDEEDEEGKKKLVQINFFSASWACYDPEWLPSHSNPELANAGRWQNWDINKKPISATSKNFHRVSFANIEIEWKNMFLDRANPPFDLEDIYETVN